MFSMWIAHVIGVVGIRQQLLVDKLGDQSSANNVITCRRNRQRNSCSCHLRTQGWKRMQD